MTTWEDVEKQQKELCKRLNLLWTPVGPNLMIAFNDSLFSKSLPINGLRHLREKNIDGWYLWRGGEIPVDDDHYFKPIHPIHLIESQPIVLKYLGLPYGYRFQIDDHGYEDVWYDKSILHNK